MRDQENLLLEIGVEELPASYVESALVQLPDLFEKRLAQARLTHAGVEAHGTPRRLAVIVDDLMTRQPDLSETLVGPPVRVAFDNAGRPTKAAESFAKKVGCEVEQLERVETPKGIYLAGVRQEAGRPATELLGQMLAEICGSISFRKSMRWSDGEAVFGRPVRWLLAMLGDTPIEFSFAGLTSSNTTRGHRFLAPEPIVAPSADDYIPLLREAHVVVELEDRREEMMARLREAAGAAGATLVEDAFLVRENENLVEEPHVVVGTFEERFLALPEDVIVAVAKGHQRYFCARKADGKLAPIYLSVVGTAESPENIRRGNDRVMRARLSDAEFFFREDMKVPLEDRRKNLGGIVFQDRLGSVLEKVERMERLVPKLGALAGLDKQTIETARQGVRLCKCDLASLMVGEFPELQGEMGAAYALGQGKGEAVADVIRGHYQPKGASDATASSDSAALAGLADRLDTLVGCFAIGFSPTGAADPYALRRACLGVLRTIIDRSYGVSITAAVDAAYDGYEGKRLDLDKGATRAKLSDFFRDRLRGLLSEKHPHDVVDACLTASHDEPMDVLHRVVALAGLEATIRTRAGEVFKRATNIAKEAPLGPPVDPSSVSSEVHDAETSLFSALRVLDGRLVQAQKTRDFPAAFAAVADVAPLLGAYFEHVMVMVPDTVVRENRLRLMRTISERCSGLAQFNLLT